MLIVGGEQLQGMQISLYPRAREMIGLGVPLVPERGGGAVVGDDQELGSKNTKEKSAEEPSGGFAGRFHDGGVLARRLTGRKPGSGQGRA